MFPIAMRVRNSVTVPACAVTILSVGRNSGAPGKRLARTCRSCVRAAIAKIRPRLFSFSPLSP